MKYTTGGTCPVLNTARTHALDAHICAPDAPRAARMAENRPPQGMGRPDPLHDVGRGPRKPFKVVRLPRCVHLPREP